LKLAKGIFGPARLNTYAAYHVMRGGVDPWGLETGSVLNYFNSLVNDPTDGADARALKASIDKLKKMDKVDYKPERVNSGKSNREDREAVLEALTEERIRSVTKGWRKTANASAYRDAQYELIVKREKYRAAKVDPCLIVAFIGHYLRNDFFEDNGLSQPKTEFVPSGQKPSENSQSHVEVPRNVGCNVSFGATSCFAGMTEGEAAGAGYNTIPSRIGPNTWLAGSGEIAKNHPKKNILQIDPKPLMVHAKSMVDAVRKRAADRLDPNAPCPCDKVEVIIVWGSHTW
jgi:hypothetical protein